MGQIYAIPLSIFTTQFTTFCPQKTTRETPKTREIRPFHHTENFRRDTLDLKQWPFSITTPS
jgi:hypothetical protein